VTIDHQCLMSKQRVLRYIFHFAYLLLAAPRRCWRHTRSNRPSIYITDSNLSKPTHPSPGVCKVDHEIIGDGVRPLSAFVLIVSTLFFESIITKEKELVFVFAIGLLRIFYFYFFLIFKKKAYYILMKHEINSGFCVRAFIYHYYCDL